MRRRACGDLGQGAAGGDRRIDLHQGVAFAFDGEVVALLDQQPVVALGRLAAIGLHADQGPFALQPLAVQHHLDLAPGEGGVEVRLLRLPRTGVPHLHRAGAIVALGDGPLERSVIQRMVLDLDRQALDLEVAGGRLGDGPGFQHAVVLDPKVVVQARRGVPLDQVATGRRLGRTLAPFRLGRGRKVPLGLVGVQFAAHGRLLR